MSSDESTATYISNASNRAAIKKDNLTTNKPEQQKNKHKPKMSSDESRATYISNISNRTATKKDNITTDEPEQRKINLIGNFVLGLYHRSLITLDNGWCIEKTVLRKEYDNFVNSESRENKKLVGKANVGALLSLCGFLINTPRGSNFYKIKHLTLFKFRNDKIKELDNLKKNSDKIITINTKMTPENNSLNLEENAGKFFIQDNLEIDEKVPKLPLEYQGTIMKQRIPNYCPTNTSCYICEEDFSTMDEFEEHIQEHGEEKDFEYLSSLKKFDNPIFTLNYSLCKKSHYFCFEIKTLSHDIIMEKIIIVQSRSFYYVLNNKMPYKIPQDGRDCFFVDSHLFTRHVEQPIVLICHKEGFKETRIIEQHHFMRSEEFPEVYFAINPWHLPNKKNSGFLKG